MITFLWSKKMNRSEITFVMIMLLIVAVVASGLALVMQVKLKDAHRTIRIQKAAISADADRSFETTMAMMDRPGIITKVDYITDKDADKDEVYIYTVFPWGTVKGKCSKEFFENVHNFPQNREQIMKHLNNSP